MCMDITAKDVHVGFDENGDDIYADLPFDKLAAGARKCLRLREITFMGDGKAIQSALRILAPQVRNSLEILKIYSEVLFERNEQDLFDPDALLPNVRKFCFSGRAEFYYFEGLSSALPNLETAEMECAPDYPEDINGFCDKTVNEFLRCPFLQELSVDTIDRIQWGLDLGVCSRAPVEVFFWCKVKSLVPHVNLHGGQFLPIRRDADCQCSRFGGNPSSP